MSADDIPKSVRDLAAMLAKLRSDDAVIYSSTVGHLLTGPEKEEVGQALSLLSRQDSKAPRTDKE